MAVCLNETAKHQLLDPETLPTDLIGNQTRLRDVVMKELDIQHNPKRKVKDDWAILRNPHMQTIITRRLTHMKGHQKLLQWVADTEKCATPKVGVSFWHDAGASNAKKKQMLPDSFVTGIASAVSVGGLQVTLLAYAPISNVPPGVHVSARRKYCNSIVLPFKTKLRHSRPNGRWLTHQGFCGGGAAPTRTAS